jgi:hypothetical protein
MYGDVFDGYYILMIKFYEFNSQNNEQAFQFVRPSSFVSKNYSLNFLCT